MGPADITLVDAISGLSGAALLVLAIVAFLRGWIVTGREHDTCRDDVDFWRTRALRALDAGERLADSNGDG